MHDTLDALCDARGFPPDALPEAASLDDYFQFIEDPRIRSIQDLLLRQPLVVPSSHKHIAIAAFAYVMVLAYWLSKFDDIEHLLLTAAERRRDQAAAAEHLPTISRMRGHRRARVFAVSLATEMRRWYGRVLYGTVATLTTIALKLPEGQEIEAEKVREWCRPIRQRLTPGWRRK
jgi:hypothetical protein